jgi:4-azaleucine resistance transporter AzlC
VSESNYPEDEIGLRRGIVLGIVKAIPILLAYLPLGVVFGLLARESGFGLAEIALMSATVYSGMAQIIGVKMFVSGVGLWSIYLVVFAIGMRHSLMSITLAPFLGRVKKIHLALLACGITDEPFALGIHEFRHGSGSTYVFTGIVFMSWFSWVISCVIGFSLGRFSKVLSPYGLKFVLPGLLICLTVFQIKQRFDIIAAFTAAGLTILFLHIFTSPMSMSLIVISIIAATSGALSQRWIER